MIILGVNSVFHESSAAVVVTGRIVASAEEERFNRRKHAKPADIDNAHVLPAAAIEFCMEQAEITAEDIDAVAFSFDPALRRKTFVEDQYSIDGHWGSVMGEQTFLASLDRVPDAICEVLGRGVPVEWVRHHLAHAASTSYAELDLSRIPQHLIDVLFECRFTIRADETHNDTGELEPVSLLWGDRHRPFLRVDDYFADPLPGDGDARAALDALIGALCAGEQAVAHRPGEVVFIDNHLAAHGRRPFAARYDGTDRWIKRVSVTRDLRRSRALRQTSTSRVLEAAP